MKYIVRDVERAVCLRFNITPEVMRSPVRTRRIARARQIAYFLAREMTNASYPQIGRHFRRDHTTAISGRRRVLSLLSTDPDASMGSTRADVQSVRDILANLTPYKESVREAVCDVPVSLAAVSA